MKDQKAVQSDLEPEIRTLSDGDVEVVCGGMRKIPQNPEQPPVAVYYDDGITVWTSDPSKSNYRPAIT
jgi:hypothetical protein